MYSMSTLGRPSGPAKSRWALGWYSGHPTGPSPRPRSASSLTGLFGGWSERSGRDCGPEKTVPRLIPAGMSLGTGPAGTGQVRLKRKWGSEPVNYSVDSAFRRGRLTASPPFLPIWL